MNINNLPEINFIEDSLEDIITRNIKEFEEAYLSDTGKALTLYPGDKLRIYIYSKSLREYQMLQHINDLAKSNLLKYAPMDILRHMGAFYNVEPIEAKASISDMQITLSKTFETDYVIPKGTRFTPGENIYFETESEYKITAGELSTTVPITCMTKGIIGNNFVAGQINKLVDNLPFIASIANTITSHSGAEIESEESFRESIRLAPSKMAIAGPDEAYEARAKAFSTDILDAHAESPTPGVVQISVSMINGEPTADELNDIQAFCSDKKYRPLTDNVTVVATTKTNYEIELTYYISQENELLESVIQDKVNQAIEDYKTWQRSNIGKDVNPSKLYSMVIAAGANRIEMVSPTYLNVPDNNIAFCSSLSVTYGGLENV